METLQPAPLSIRSIGVRIKPNRAKGERIMPDAFIRHLLKAAIESFPINKAKKEVLLQSIISQKKMKGAGK